MSKLSFEYIIQHYYKIFVTVLIFIVYIVTMAPSVQQIDSGELAAVQCTLGIAHPTGYPLFTMIGYIFHLIPMPFSSILKLNILSAIWSCVSIYFFLLSMQLVFEKIYVNLYLRSSLKKKSMFRKTQSAAVGILDQQHLEILAVSGSGLILAFNKTFWMQSTGVEVYSLHMAIISAAIYLLFRILFKTEKNVAKATENWMIVAMVLALGFSNHMTTVLILPAAAVLFYEKERLNLTSLRIFGTSSLVFIIILIFFYSYLPTRASMNPILNWGDPSNLDNIIRHVSGHQYQVWLFSSVDAAKQNLLKFYEVLKTEFFIPVFIFMVVGLAELLLRSRILFAFVLICFVTTVFYAINYDINDIDSYFLLAYYSLAIISFFGIIVVFKFLRFISLPRKITSAVLVIIILGHGAWNFTKVNQSGLYLFEDYTKTILNSVEDNSIIFSYQWDYFISPSYYFQFVDNYREDVLVIDKELLRRSWYYKQLKNRNRTLFQGFDNDVVNFLALLRPFERGEEYNSEEIEKYYRRIQKNLIAFNIDEHNYYLAPELVDNELRSGELELPKGYNIVPQYLLFKVVKGNKYVPAPLPDFKWRFPKNPNRYTDFIERLTAQMLSNRAIYELQFRKTEMAKIYVRKIVANFPEFELPDQLKKLADSL